MSFFYVMIEIIPNLYLSSFHDAKKHPLTPTAFVVNCTKDMPLFHNNSIRIPVDDDGTPQSMHEMFSVLPSIVERIDRELKNNPVIVHCLAGMQRSPTVIAAYLITKYPELQKLEDVIKYIRTKKPEAFLWAVNFRDSLERYEMFIRSSKPNTTLQFSLP